MTSTLPITSNTNLLPRLGSSPCPLFRLFPVSLIDWGRGSSSEDALLRSRQCIRCKKKAEQTYECWLSTRSSSSNCLRQCLSPMARTSTTCPLSTSMGWNRLMGCQRQSLGEYRSAFRPLSRPRSRSVGSRLRVDCAPESSNSRFNGASPSCKGSKYGCRMY